MLIRFRASNFRSLRDEVELSMVASSEDDPASVVPCEALGLSLLRVAAIYGANAAGKSNVLAAMAFMSEAVRDSRRVWKPEGPIPCQPFLLDQNEDPSFFEADFFLEGVRYRYGFRLDSQSILGEWLYAYPSRRSQRWFSREEDAAFTFGKQLKGHHRAIEPLTRKNTLFLSVAAENNHPALSPIYTWLARNLHMTNRELYRTLTIWTLGKGRDEDFQARLLHFLTQADLGIVGWDISRREPGRREFPEIELRHRSGSEAQEISIPFREESQGTQAWFTLGAMLLRTLDSGAVLTVDELDASLHPHLALEVVRIFQDPARNPRNAQLIFNTHDTNLLRSLRRDQIWFVEKDEGGATHLYPLTDFKPRKGENLERGYLQGRYGAIPFLGDLPSATDGSSED
jgi:hypothetical protein